MQDPWQREQWCSSPHTFIADVQAQIAFPKKIELLDLSLDENGEGMAGAHLSEDQKLAVAETLDEMGVHRIGVLGYPERITNEEKALLKQEVTAAKRIAKAVKKSALSALATSAADIERAAEVGVRDVVIRKYVSKVQDIEPESNEKRIADFVELAEKARSLGLRVGILAQGITRANLETDVREILTGIHAATPLDEICLTDTHGVGTPQGFAYLVRRVKSWVDVPLQVHCHNHLGLGVANACFAAAAGASVIHTTMHGLGHFAGLAPLEEVIVALSVGYGVTMDVDAQRLYALSQDIQRYTGITMPPHKAVVGSRAFVMSNDVMYNQLNLDRKDAGVPRTATLPYLPEMVGNQERVYLGIGLSRVAVKWNLALLNVEATDTEIDDIFAAALSLIEQREGEISESEFAAIISRCKAISREPQQAASS
ncbi:hypothetical protein ACFOOL_09685 [Devosia honganensis]|uniref:Pyruvate carboxyltransferase domain-containing protein n=1 Tax=Devosia honganensis TaxID=1610527 RepID=A0ABV7X0H3_9HYPH